MYLDNFNTPGIHFCILSRFDYSFEMTIVN